MTRRYSGSGLAAVGTNKTILTLVSASTIRPMIYEFTVGCNATPADLSTLFHLERFTAAGTEGGGFTPLPLDPADPASLGDYGVGVFSVEPTYTANEILYKLSLHQMATWRFNASPGSEFKAPATAANGMGIQAQASGSVSDHEATILHVE